MLNINFIASHTQSPVRGMDVSSETEFIIFTKEMALLSNGKSPIARKYLNCHKDDFGNLNEKKTACKQQQINRCESSYGLNELGEFQ